MEVCVDTVKKYKKEWEYLINGGELPPHLKDLA